MKNGSTVIQKVRTGVLMLAVLAVSASWAHASDDAVVVRDRDVGTVDSDPGQAGNGSPKGRGEGRGQSTDAARERRAGAAGN